MYSYAFEDYTFQIELQNEAVSFQMFLLNKVLFEKAFTSVNFPIQLQQCFKNIKSFFDFFQDQENFIVDEEKGIITIMVKTKIDDKFIIKNIEIFLDKAKEGVRKKQKQKLKEKFNKGKKKQEIIQKQSQTNQPEVREEIAELRNEIYKIQKAIGFWLNPTDENLQIHKVLQTLEPRISFIEQNSKKEKQFYDKKLTEIFDKLQENRRYIESIKHSIKQIQLIPQNFQQIEGEKQILMKKINMIEEKLQLRIEKERKQERQQEQKREKEKKRKIQQKAEIEQLKREELQKIQMAQFRKEFEEWRIQFYKKKETFEMIQQKKNQSGSQYCGEKKDGKRHGFGIQFLSNGTYSEGEFSQNKINGKVISYFHNGDQYQGQAVDSVAKGKGVYKRKNGDWQEGEWVNNKRFGRFFYHYANGKTEKRIYEYDKLISKE